MRLLLTEDPGIRGAGVAIFDMDESTLLRAAYVKSPCVKGRVAEECRAVGTAIKSWVGERVSALELLGAEWPVILDESHQKGAKQKIDKNDLLALSGVSVAFAMAFSHVPVRSFFPREWKQTVDPDVMTRRIVSRLSQEELERVEYPERSRTRDPSGGVNHNIFDAIGIGLHILGRLERKRVYAGVSE